MKVKQGCMRSLICCLIPSLIFSCKGTVQPQQLPKMYTVIELNLGTQPFYKNTKPADLKSYEIELLDTIISFAMTDFNQKREEDFEKLLRYSPGMKDSDERYLMEVDSYYRQYVPYINQRDEKVVSVNCFCKVDGLSGESNGLNWRKDLIQINDGGNCYFHLVVNLTSLTVTNLMVNGLA